MEASMLSEISTHGLDIICRIVAPGVYDYNNLDRNFHKNAHTAARIPTLNMQRKWAPTSSIQSAACLYCNATLL
jgi:hypothetical protein